MSDETTETTIGHRPDGANPSQVDDGTTQKPIADDLLKHAKSKGFSHGYNERTKAICEEFGVGSLDELKGIVGAYREDLDQKEAMAMAEKEEKESLAKELQEVKKRSLAFEAEAQQLSNLRSEMRNERLKNEGLSRGVIPSAMPLLLRELDPVVQWNDDFSKLRTEDGDIEDFDTVFDKVKESHPYLFEAKNRQGVKMSSDPKSDRPVWKPSYSPLEERIKGY